jgi:streptogramin lyase
VSEGGVYTLNLAAIDPGDDTISGWTINWGDGTVEQVVGDPSSVTHTYAVGGFTYDILASASDEDGTYLQNELFVPSFDGDQVFRFDATTGGFLQAFATPDDPIEADMGPDGRLFVSGERSDNVRRHDAATGGFIEEFVAATDGGLDESEGLAWGPDGHLYVASYRTDEVLRYDGTTGAFIDVFASTGLDKPYDVVFGPDGNLYVNTYTANEVLRYNGTTGAFIDVFVAAGTGGLNTPEQMAFGPDGNLYVNSFGSDEVLRYNGTTGAFIDVFVAAGGAEDLDQPSGLAFGPDGHLYVGDHVDAVVLRYDGTTGTFIDEYVAPGSGGLTKPALLSFRPEQQVGVIAPVNQDPVAADDADGSDDPNDFRTVLLADLFIPAAELLDNDTDPEFEPLTVVATGPTPTAEGSAQCDGTGCTYTPNGTYLGPDTFTYTISDGNGGTATATVTVYVTDYVVSPDRGDIVVNEVMHDGDTRLLLERSDFVELANPTASPVNVSGWMLSDNNLIVDDTDAGGGFEFVLPPGTVIPANDYAVVWMGSDRSGVDPGFTNVIGGGVLELYYGSWSNWLEESGDEVTIYDDRYQIVDHVAWGPDTAPDRNAPIPAGMGVWDTLPNNEVNLQATGQGTAIALTPDNTFTADSFCWEINESGAATCPGALPTVDTDTYGTRSTSVGRPNNAAGPAPARSKSPPGPHARATRSAI